jgi:hypothetical protein
VDEEPGCAEWQLGQLDVVGWGGLKYAGDRAECERDLAGVCHWPGWIGVVDDATGAVGDGVDAMVETWDSGSGAVALRSGIGLKLRGRTSTGPSTFCVRALRLVLEPDGSNALSAGACTKKRLIG